MKSNDKALGMDRAITRRDILQGMGAVAAASFVPGKAFADLAVAQEGSPYYPPALTGMRGSHAGSFEVAHQLAREGRTDWGPVSSVDKAYDLVVVGAGLSGLAAAWFYHQDNPGARILILDNHDDFGGHAKRNEFSVGGREVLGFGGSQTLENPYDYSRTLKKLLRSLGINIRKLGKAYDQGFYRRHGLRGGMHFNAEDWGRDCLVPLDIGGMRYTLPLSESMSSMPERINEMPLSEQARGQLLKFLQADMNQFKGWSDWEVEEYLYTMSYQDFLEKHGGITDGDLQRMFHRMAYDTGLGIDSASAGSSLLYVGLPGIHLTGLDDTPFEDNPYIHHFPDGNASVARLMVRQLIPGVAPGSTMEDIVKARFDYNGLDKASNDVRLRLNSTVVNVSQEKNSDVTVTYVQNGSTYSVKSRNCVLACYNAVIPSICPELPTSQKKALAHQVKTPILYTNVMLNNWRAFKKLGIGAFLSPSSYHVNAMLDFPVSMGGQQYAESEDDPIILHMQRFAFGGNGKMSKQDQFRLGRYELLSTPFEEIERSIREQLASALSGGGFDPANDIEAITVNRWAHGYSYSYDFRHEPYYEDWNDERYPHVQARQPFGRVTIANADAGASANINSSVMQAYRAVNELS